MISKKIGSAKKNLLSVINITLKIHSCRRFAPNIFLVLKPFLKNCGVYCTKFELFLLKILMWKSEKGLGFAKLLSGDTDSQNLG